MKPEKRDKDLIDSYDYLATAASKQEMTGLIPAKPTSEEELESYKELFHYLPPNSDVKNINP